MRAVGRVLGGTATMEISVDELWSEGLGHMELHFGMWFLPWG